MKTQTFYQIERYTTLAQLDALEKDWSDLVNEIPDVPIFLTWEWIRTWWVFFGKGRQLWLLTAKDKNGRLLGLAPLMKEVQTTGFVKLGMISFIGTGRVCPTHLKILARTSDLEGLYRAFLDYLLGQSDQWDILSIASVAQDSPENGLLLAAGGRIRIGAQLPSLYIQLPGSWEAYLETISRKLRYNIRFYGSKLEADHPGLVHFVGVTDPRELDNAMERLTELIRRRCRAKRLSTDFDDPTFLNFHQAIAHLSLDRGWLRFYTLIVKDQVIALIYDFCYKDRIYGYNAGYDIEWSGYGPGRLLMAYSIQKAIQEAATVYNFGRGDSDYKYAWTDHIRMENVILFSSNWKGDLWIKFGNFERALKIKAKRLLDRSDETRIENFQTKRHKRNVDRSEKEDGREILERPALRN